MAVAIGPNDELVGAGGEAGLVIEVAGARRLASVSGGPVAGSVSAIGETRASKWPT